MNLDLLPSVVEIGPYRHRISNDPAKFLKQESEYGEVVYGLSSIENQTIFIKPGMGRDATADTLLHECLHMILQTSSAGLSAADEETVVRAITPQLLDMLRKNPDIVVYLLER
jgi:hypothetical protein